jgi:hypothetical protein
MLVGELLFDLLVEQRTIVPLQYWTGPYGLEGILSSTMLTLQFWIIVKGCCPIRSFQASLAQHA